jgi:hypothetical protein
LEQAKAALVKSKQVELLESDAPEVTPVEDGDRTVTGVAVGTRPAKLPAEEAVDADNEEDEALLQAIQQESSDHDMDKDPPSGPVAFTLEEMMDADMMTEFATMGMDVPSVEDYSAKILECKKQALANKQQNNIPQATQWLRKSKQLEAVQTALQNINGGDATNEMDEDAWMNSLNAEDTSLLQELFASADELPEFDGDMDGDDDTLPQSEQTLSVDELMAMSDSDVMDFIEMMGRSSLPTLDELNDMAVQHQKAAVGHKQSGLLDNAKKSLVEFKKAKHQAERLGILFRRLDAKESGAPTEQSEMTFNDLEAMVNGGDQQMRPKPQPTPKAPPPLSNPWLSMSSAEIKQEVIRLKNAKQVKEATELLQILKQVIQKEKDKAEATKCQQMTETLQVQLDVCQAQLKLWQLYEWFVNPVRGKEQSKMWSGYQNVIGRAIEDVKTKGSSAVTIACLPKDIEPTLFTLNGDDLQGLVESGPHTEASPPNLDGDIEVSVLGLVDMHRNSKLVKAWKKHSRTSKDIEEATCPRVWIDTKVQLPLNPNDATQPVHLAFRPTCSKLKGSEFEYEFNPESKHSQQRLKLPMKDSKEAKTLKRRLETKTVQCSVYMSPQQEQPVETKKTSWFFGSRTTKEEELEDHSENKGVLIGKVTVELHPLLLRSCIIGDFPLSVNNQEIGGVVRVVIRAVSTSSDTVVAPTSTNSAAYRGQVIIS